MNKIRWTCGCSCRRLRSASGRPAMRRNAERMSWGSSNAGYTSLVRRPTHVACDLAYEQRGEPRWLRDTPRYDQRAKHLPRSSIIAYACFLHKAIVSSSTPSYFLLCCVGGRAAWAGSSLLEIPSWPSSGLSLIHI